MAFIVLFAGAVGVTGPDVAWAAKIYRPRHIPSDSCSTGVDVTREFNAWLATVPDGARIDLARGGCYLVNENTTISQGDAMIAFVKRYNITINGNNATIKTTQKPVPTPDGRPQERAQLYFEGGGGFVVRNLTLQGTNDTADCAIEAPPSNCNDRAMEVDHNIRLRAVDGALFDNVRFRNVWGDGLEAAPGRLSPEAERTMSRNVTIRNSTVDTVGRHAFSCTGCKNFTVQNNAATNIGQHVIDLELETPVATGDLKLVGNTFSNYYLSIVNAVGNSGLAWGPLVLQQNTAVGQSATCAPPFWLVPNSRRLDAVTITDNRVDAAGYFAEIGAEPSADFPEPPGAAELNITGNTGMVWHGSCGTDELPPPANTSGLPGGPFPAVIVRNTPSGSIANNTFINADPVAKRDSSSSAVTVCGNKTTVDGGFDQPLPCS